MKKIISTLSLVFLMALQVLIAQDQNDSPEQSTTSKDKIMFTLAFDNLFHKETNGFKTKWSSRGVGLHFMYDIPIKKSKVSFAIGGGFSHTSYYHNSTVNEDSIGTFFSPIEDFNDSEEYKRVKLTTNFVELPLELRIRSNPDKKGHLWKVALGFKTGFRLVASSKEVRKENGYFKKIKTKGYQDVNLFRAGPTFRVGYGSLNLAMFYSVTELFKKNKGPKMTPFSIGLTFTAL